MLRMDTAQGARAALGEAAQFVRLQRVVVNARTARDQPWRKLMHAISITFPRRWPWCAALLLVAVACKGSETTAALTTGSIRVTAATGGTDLDPDGYTVALQGDTLRDRKSTRLNSSHSQISYAVFCLKKKKKLTTSRVIPCKSNDNRIHDEHHT